MTQQVETAYFKGTPTERKQEELGYVLLSAHRAWAIERRWLLRERSPPQEGGAFPFRSEPPQVTSILMNI